MGPRRSGQSLHMKPRGTFNPGIAQVVGDPPSNYFSSNSINKISIQLTKDQSSTSFTFLKS
jgi:hypothetical protein